MSGLPQAVQRAPALLYATAVLYLIGSIWLQHYQLENAMGAGVIGGQADGMLRLAQLAAWLQALEGAVYIAAYGVLAHIGIAIWRDGRLHGRMSDTGAVE